MYGACRAVTCEALVFSPTIRKTCPRRGTAAWADATGNSVAAATTAHRSFMKRPLIDERSGRVHARMPPTGLDRLDRHDETEALRELPNGGSRGRKANDCPEVLAAPRGVRLEPMPIAACRPKGELASLSGGRVGRCPKTASCRTR